MSRILVIDSANLFVQYVGLVVERYGYVTKGVSTGEEAISLLEAEPFDLVIAQESLPDMDWPSFCSKMVAGPERAQIPVVVLSSDIKRIDDSQCQGLTLAKVSTRPVSMKDLLKVIGQHLPYRNRRRGIRASLPMKAIIREDDRSIPCQILNLSEGGVFVMKKEPRPIGTDIELLLPFGDSPEPLKVRGKVVYVVETARRKHPRGMGIQFSEEGKGIRNKLRGYLDSYISNMLRRGPV